MSVLEPPGLSTGEEEAKALLRQMRWRLRLAKSVALGALTVVVLHGGRIWFQCRSECDGYSVLLLATYGLILSAAGLVAIRARKQRGG